MRKGADTGNEGRWGWRGTQITKALKAWGKDSMLKLGDTLEEGFRQGRPQIRSVTC